MKIFQSSGFKPRESQKTVENLKIFQPGGIFDFVVVEGKKGSGFVGLGNTVEFVRISSENVVALQDDPEKKEELVGHLLRERGKMGFYYLAT